MEEEEDGTPQGCTRSPAVSLGKGQGTPGMLLQGGEHPGAASRACHCHREKDGASWGSISSTERRMGHGEDAAPEMGAGQSPSGVHPASVMSLRREQGTLGLHLRAQEKDVVPWKHIQIPSLPPREGQSILGVHLWGQEKDRAF